MPAQHCRFVTADTGCDRRYCPGGTDPICDQATLDELMAALAADPMGFASVGIQDINGDGRIR